jgi:hypothetical protein
MASDSSASSQGSRRSFESMMATFTPSAAKIDAYSQPATPPPRMASERGIRSSIRIESES